MENMTKLEILELIGAEGTMEVIGRWEKDGALYTKYRKNGKEFIVRLS